MKNIYTTFLSIQFRIIYIRMYVSKYVCKPTNQIPYYSYLRELHKTNSFLVVQTAKQTLAFGKICLA